MPTVFNPFTGTLDFVDQGGTQWLPPVQSEGDLPLTDPDGSARIVRDTDSVYVFDSGNSKWYKQSPEIGTFNGTSTANGLSVTETDDGNVTDFLISLHAADSTNPGAVSTDAQNFAGNKTFDNDVIITGDLTVNGTTTTINTTTLDVTDANITVNKGGNQATADTNDAGITVEMSDAIDAIIGYDSTLTSKFFIGEVGSTAEIADVSSSQTFQNKEIIVANNTVTTAASGNLTSTELNSALAELQTDIDTRALQTDLDAHINDATDAHAASAITNAPSGNLAATNVQDALNELQTDVDGRANTALSNLTSPTSINQFLLPAAALDLGNSSNEWRRLYLDRDATTDEIFLKGSTRIGTGGTSPSGKTILGALRAVSSSGSQSLGLYSVDSGTSTQSHPLTLETGNNTSTGNSGNIDLIVGTVNSGTRGAVNVDARKINLDSDESIDLIQQQRITNVTDPSAAQDVATKNYVDNNINFQDGDLYEVTFNLANNQSTFADVTGVAFANGVVRSAELQYSIVIDADSDLYETGNILAVQRGADWVVSHSALGDNSQVLFDINASGQLQYKSADYTGFVNGTLKVRAMTTSV